MYALFLLAHTAAAAPIIDSWEDIVTPPSAGEGYWEEQRQLILEECSYDIAFCQRVYTAQPRATRNPNLYRFTDPELLNPSLIPIHLARFYDIKTPESVRLALLDLLRKTDGEWAQGLLPAIQDPSETIRKSLAEISRYSTPETAQEMLSTLSSDLSESVRAAAVQGMGYQDSNTFRKELERGLQDESSLVRYSAARSIGWSNTTVPLLQLLPLLSDESALVRLHTLRTIDRLYPEQARDLKQLPVLQQDPDPKVRAEAQRVQTL